jgi:hypothetical protein
MGLWDLRSAFDRIRQTSFHVSPAILASLLDGLASNLLPVDVCLRIDAMPKLDGLGMQFLIKNNRTNFNPLRITLEVDR